MPVIRVEMLEGRTPAQKSELAAVFTREMARIAKCSAEHVQVVFIEVARGDWAIGGVFSEATSSPLKSQVVGE